MKEIKVLQLDVGNNSRFILPADYVNWVRISQFRNGVLYPMSENIQTNWSSAYLQDNNDRILFDQDGNPLSPQDSQVDLSRGKSRYISEQQQYVS